MRMNINISKTQAMIMSCNCSIRVLAPFLVTFSHWLTHISEQWLTKKSHWCQPLVSTLLKARNEKSVFPLQSDWISASWRSLLTQAVQKGSLNVWLMVAYLKKVKGSAWEQLKGTHCYKPLTSSHVGFKKQLSFSQTAFNVWQPHTFWLHVLPKYDLWSR